MLFRQRGIVLELLNTGGGIVMPGRHHALAGSVFYQRSEGHYLLVGLQWHRADTVRIVAAHALLLQDRSHIPGVDRRECATVLGQHTTGETRQHQEDG